MTTTIPAGWLPIESAPKDELILVGPTKRMGICVAMNHSRDGWVTETCNEWSNIYTPTHWMPLPSEPGAAPGVSTVEDAQDGVTVLPDGSACALASFPLPATHWLYAEREYAPGAEEPKELPAPILTHAQRDAVVAAIRYAVRGATMCGKEQDFDPDALVQNAVYALCGPYGPTVAAPAAGDALDAARYRFLLEKSTVSMGYASLCAFSAHNRDTDFFSREEGLQALESAIDAAIAAQRKGGA